LASKEDQDLYKELSAEGERLFRLTKGKLRKLTEGEKSRFHEFKYKLRSLEANLLSEDGSIRASPDAP